MRIAFKEWAVVVDALGRGNQILVLRKGGIHEGRGGFQPEHDRFWLFPTAFHQQRDSVIAEARPRFDQHVAPAFAVDTVPVQFLAELESVFEVTSLDAALQIAEHHILTEEVVRSRFEWGGSQRIFALLLRVLALPEPIQLESRPEYGGCKSWIELAEDLDESRLQPVLSRAVLQSRCVAIEMTLQPAPLLK